MKSFRDFKKILDSRPAYNNPKDDADAGMDDKMKAHWKEKTLYGGDIKSLKKRMHDAHRCAPSSPWASLGIRLRS